MKKRLVLLAGLPVVLLAIVLIRYAPKHPILLKCVTFTAKSLGQPVEAVIYTDGQINTEAKMFSAGGYLLLYLDNPSQARQIIGIHHNYVGTPVGTSLEDYDYFWGRLFQSQTGGIFVSFDDRAKRSYRFNPQLKYGENEITFNLPPQEEEFHFRSVQIRIDHRH